MRDIPRDTPEKLPEEISVEKGLSDKARETLLADFTERIKERIKESIVDQEYIALAPNHEDDYIRLKVVMVNPNQQYHYIYGLPGNNPHEWEYVTLNPGTYRGERCMMGMYENMVYISKVVNPYE